METGSALSPTHQQYLSLDFFSLAGLEASSDFDANSSAADSRSINDSNSAPYIARVKSAPGTPLDDPSPISLEPSRSNSGRGHSRQLSRSKSSQDVHYEHDMDVDHAPNNAGQVGSGGATPDDLLGMEMSGANYDAMQAGILQHQVGYLILKR